MERVRSTSTTEAPLMRERGVKLSDMDNYVLLS
jgi:hypothetical protein